MFDVRAALFALLGKDLTQINGLGPYLALKLIAECGDDLSAWPSAKHFSAICFVGRTGMRGASLTIDQTQVRITREAR